MNRPRLLLLSILFICLIPSCVRNPATRKVHARLLSQESERRIGEETKKKILEEYEVLSSTTVNEYVNRVGEKLAAVCDRPTVDYSFTVLDQDLINAFAVPGGYIFVTRGLLDSVDDEGELAIVLGHEIGHVAAMHGVQMIQKEMGENALTMLGTIGAALTVGPEAMLMVNNTANLFSSLYLLGYSRDKELEADRLGLQYTLRAGYDPHAALRFFKKLQAVEVEDKNAGGWDLYFRTHPATSERIAIIESMIGDDTKEDFTKSKSAEYQKVKANLPRVNLAERGVITGQTYENQYHRLSLSVPTNWRLGFYYSTSLVSFQTTDKKAEGRLQVVDLGPIITKENKPEEPKEGERPGPSSGEYRPKKNPNKEKVVHPQGPLDVTPEDLALQYAKVMDYKFFGGRNVLYSAGYGFLGRFMGVTAGGNQLDIRLFATIRHGRGYILQVGAPPEEQESYLLDLESITRALRFKDS